MLLNLHVKNFALIEESDIDFGDGLNILTGETGAGKSILIDSVNAALGSKIRGDVIRTGCDSAYVELTFSIPEEEKRIQLEELGIDTEYECITVSRRIYPHRSVHKINGETVSSAIIRQATALLLDIHGQHEHQSLMNLSRHLEILDQYGGAPLEEQRSRTESAYQRYQNAKKAMESYAIDTDTRLREMDFLRFEINEIEEAQVRPGETEELEGRYRKMQNSQKIVDNLRTVSAMLDDDGRSSVRSLISGAGREMTAAARLDEDLTGMQEELAEIEDLLGEFLRDLEHYLDDLSFDSTEFHEVLERLDLVHHIESKYGSGWEEIQNTLEKKQEKLNDWMQFEKNQAKAESELNRAYKELLSESLTLSQMRKTAAPGLIQELTDGIKELNFNYVDFRISFRESEQPGRLGMDSVEFMISLNPGAEPRSLGQVASGGELSRIMLAIKTVLADKDEIPTLIFDEIDTGISGRTAQSVSEKLNVIGKHRQVICITHLPQIASMADHHYGIRKTQTEGHTITEIRLLDETASIEELARLLGGAEMTEVVYQNACEMKILAGRKKGIAA